MFKYEDQNLVEKHAQKYWNTSRAWRGLKQPDIGIRAFIDVLHNCQSLGTSPCQRIVDYSASLLDLATRREAPRSGRKSV